MEPNEVFESVQPFTGEMLHAPQETPAVMAEATAQREIAEVQSMMVIAKKYPRNQAKAMDRILVSCQRPSLAEGALYSYSRGGTEITGPSIRLAEAIAQQWGNLAFGIRELDQRLGESTVEAFAWDLETNTRQSKIFQVRHLRYTKKGSYNLTDPRDIYEMVANLGARRLRACILGIVPGDVAEAAQKQCEETLRAKLDLTPETISRILKVFEEFGISRAQLETRIQRKMESITAAQVIGLRKIYNSLRDGMSKPDDWFEMGEKVPESSPVEKEKQTRRPRSDKGTTRGHEAPQDAPEGPTPGLTTGEEEGTPQPPPQAATSEVIASIRRGIIHLNLSEATICQEWEVSNLEELDQEAAGNLLINLIQKSKEPKEEGTPL